jgi:hypothetical protein
MPHESSFENEAGINPINEKRLKNPGAFEASESTVIG